MLLQAQLGMAVQVRVRFRIQPSSESRPARTVSELLMCVSLSEVRRLPVRAQLTRSSVVPDAPRSLPRVTRRSNAYNVPGRTSPRSHSSKNVLCRAAAPRR